MAIYSAAHYIKLVSTSAYVLLMRRTSCICLGQKLRFHGSLSLIYCLHLGLDDGFRQLAGRNSKVREKQKNNSNTSVVQSAYCRLVSVCKALCDRQESYPLLHRCTPSSGTLSRPRTSSAQVGDRYVGGPTRN